MFSFFKPKKKESPLYNLLELPDTEFAEVVEIMYSETIPNGHVMCVVAYMNFNVTEEACKDLEKKRPDKKWPQNIEAHIRFIIDLMDKYKNDEIKSRRTAWFFHATMLKRLEYIAMRDACYIQRLLKIWLIVAESCRCMRVALQNNVLWSPEEKSWFDFIRSEKDGIRCCLNIVMPDFLKSEEEYLSFKEKHNINIL